MTAMSTSKKNIKSRLKSHHQLGGFTLIELLVSMAITSIVSILAIQIITQISKSFNEDQKTTANGQKMSSVLEIIGREIRQSGESVIETNFPTIQVRERGNKGASIIIYRALSEPITLCKGYAAGTTNITELILATDKSAPAAINAAKPYCTVEAAEAGTEIFPPSRKEGWIDKRLKSPLTISSNKALFGGIYSITNKSIKTFTYISESKVPSATAGGSLILKVGISPIISTPEIKVDDIAYLLEKKEYLVCGNELKVRTNSLVESASFTGTASATDPACADIITSSDPTGSVETVATNIDKLNITMVTRPTATTAVPSPASTKQTKNSNFPITASPDITWQNIEGITVNILALDPLGKQGSNPSGRTSSSLSAKDIAAFSAEGNFYPRNALSSK
jgi:prepilin-type N-terminal cleavage/methylation domain-containing protein